MEKKILAINLGSSSKKYACYSGTVNLFTAHFEKTEKGFAVSYDAGEGEEIAQDSYEKALAHVIAYAKKKFSISFDAIGMRVVGIGRQFSEDKIIDSEYEEMLERESLRDPVHIPFVVAEIIEARRLIPGVPVVAVSDSAFHSTIPEVARRYALTYDYLVAGFHGLSVASAVSKLEIEIEKLPERIIVCHLGSGVSITALKDGKSIATSMGYSPLSGVPMSTRVGDIDPEVILRLAEENGVNKAREILYTKSGLLALSEKSGDMRMLLDAEKNGDTKAKFALESFVYHVRFYIGAYAAVLGGVDTLVFSGTIGVRSESIRNRIMKDLPYKTFVIKTDEEREIAKVVRRIIN